MNLLSPTTIKQILIKYGAKPNKRLGQNFLIDENILKKIIAAADLKPDDIILEIGPGIGTLTQELAKKTKQVFAVEKDKKMCEILKETLKDFKNIEIINADILKISNFKFQISNYKVIANIPYYLTSPLIRKFLESENPPEFMVLMLQKEVAQRICSSPPHQSFKKTSGVGASRQKMSLLSVSVQFYADVKIISYVSKNSFWPSPKIDSAIIKITPHRDPFSDSVIRERVSDNFFKVVKAGFSQPRKQILGNLSKGLKLDKKQVETWLLKNNIKPSQRAETLSVEDWIKLVVNNLTGLKISNDVK